MILETVIERARGEAGVSDDMSSACVTVSACKWIRALQGCVFRLARLGATTRHGHSMQGGATTPGEPKNVQSGA
ncbi:MAG: hypothetical protein V4568_09895 [Pseudomonadota bacterium]